MEAFGFRECYFPCNFYFGIDLFAVFFFFDFLIYCYSISFFYVRV